MSKSYSCQLINPFCPDDLCVLPMNHKGQHKLSTMSKPGPVNMRRATKGGPYTDEELIAKGYELGKARGYYKRFDVE